MKFMRMLLGATLLIMATVASAETYRQGQHYKVLDNPSIPRDQNKIEVVEVFWYGCPHCYDLEPTVQAWLKFQQADVDFYQLPAQFSTRWAEHAALFYLTHALGVNDKVHEDIFDAIHKERKPLSSKSDQQEFLAEHGVSEADFDKHYDSFGVRRQLKMADQRIRQYKISGVPAVIVNGKYFVDAKTAGGQSKIFNVVNFLVEKERKAMAK